MSPLLPDPDRALGEANPLVLTLEDLLNEHECQELVERIEALGPSAAPVTTSQGMVMRPDLRNNSRVMFDDPALADLLHQRVLTHVPRRLERTWELCGANERLRCYRYEAGEYFAPHYDGAFVRDRNERSLLTYLVYLNDGAEGGATNFLDLGRSVTPRRGMGLVFNHHLYHEGATVTGGLKYVVRTDLMYRRALP